LARPVERSPLGSLGATDTVFGALVRDIVSGTFASGVRLPAERDLARSLRASRPTVREALRRLLEWRLIEARRGSGITVRHRHEWSIEVLGEYLRHAGDPGAAELVADMRMLRRSILCSVVEQIAGRVPPGAVDAARSALHRSDGRPSEARSRAEAGVATPTAPPARRGGPPRGSD
jgi:DNA-binding FadR family transcriptional regulator